jgi:hypothetical protein
LGAPLADGFRPGLRAIGSAGERLVHTEEVTGSIPVSPTISCIPGGLQVANRVQKSGPSRAGPLGASWEEFGRSTSLGWSGMDLPVPLCRREASCLVRRAARRTPDWRLRLTGEKPLILPLRGRVKPSVSECDLRSRQAAAGC